MKSLKKIFVLFGCFVLASCGSQFGGGGNPQKIDGNEITIDEAEAISKQIEEHTKDSRYSGDYKISFTEIETTKNGSGTTDVTNIDSTFIITKGGDVSFVGDTKWYDGDKEHDEFYFVKNSEHELVICAYSKYTYAEDNSVEEAWKVASKKQSPIKYEELLSDIGYNFEEGAEAIEQSVEKVSNLKEQFDEAVENYNEKGYSVTYKLYSAGKGSLCLDCVTKLVDSSKLGNPNAENLKESHEILKFSNYVFQSVYAYNTTTKDRTTEYSAVITYGNQKVSLPNGWSKHIEKEEGGATGDEKLYKFSDYQNLLASRNLSFTATRAVATTTALGQQTSKTYTYDASSQQWLGDSASDTTTFDVTNDYTSCQLMATLLGMSAENMFKCYATANSYRITGSYEYSGSQVQFEYRYGADGLKTYVYQKTIDFNGVVNEQTGTIVYSN